ncbi:MAG: hypothetical protein AB7S26_19010 [Sandaracinaceae bacterium]
MAGALALATVAHAQYRAPSFRMPDPTPVAVDRAPVRLSPEDQQHYLSDWRRAAGPSFMAPLNRWSFGDEIYLEDGQALGDSFAFGVEVGGRFVLEPGRRAGVALVPTIGYAFSSGVLTAHHLTLGVGLGWEGIWCSLTYSAQLVVGSVDETLALGARHGAVLELGNVLGISVSHDILSVEGRESLLHGVRICVTLDVLPFLLGAEEYFDD